MALQMRFTPLTLCCLVVVSSAGARLLQAEEVVKTHPDGTVSEQYEVDADGRKDGRYSRFDENGTTVEQATYKAEQLHGLRRTWAADGSPLTAWRYKLNVLHGSHKTYGPGGHLVEHKTYGGGKLHGPFKTYHPNRRLAVSAGYRKGVRHGKYHERAPDGTNLVLTTYKDGKIHGTYTVFRGRRKISKQRWRDGRALTVDDVVPFPREISAIRTMVERALRGDGSLSTVRLEADRELALRQLHAYRAIMDVPYEGLVLDRGFNDYAQAAAEICKAIGRTTHTPENPGWDATRYRFAADGANRCNLGSHASSATSVRGYMHDFGASNLPLLGHRGWCLNPAMLKTGFGTAGKFTAMYALDTSRAGVPKIDIIASPPRGHAPGAWFGDHWPWSVMFERRTYASPRKEDIEVAIQPVGRDFLPAGPAVKLDHVGVQTEGRGFPYLVIFRPVTISLAPGTTYRVTINGLRREGKPHQLRYYVRFFDLPWDRPGEIRR